ncbi:hypothetical protein MTP99_013308 [Tenebrio molitor]|nr:hypothetical protein MTP99_013308 [Tenebrio molitor]
MPALPAMGAASGPGIAGGEGRPRRRCRSRLSRIYIVESKLQGLRRRDLAPREMTVYWDKHLIDARMGPA